MDIFQTTFEMHVLKWKFYFNSIDNESALVYAMELASSGRQAISYHNSEVIMGAMAP